MEENVSVRIGKTELKDVEKISKYEFATKSAILREVIRIGIKQKMLKIAIEKYQNNEVTAAKAAEIAGIYLGDFLAVLSERGIDFHYGAEDLRKDFERLKIYDK